MLIRSQDKKSLVNMDSVINFYAFHDQVIAEYEDEDAYRILGRYSTEEKNIKVLDMIQSVYEASLYSNDAFDCAASVRRPYIFANNAVFQMPQENEV